MKRIHHMASVIRRRVFRNSVRKTTERMDPAVRSALAQDVAEQVEEEVNVDHELDTIEKEIEKAKEFLQKSQAKEIFLGQRSAQYRKVLDERVHSLRQEQDELHARKRRLLDETTAIDEEADAAIKEEEKDLAQRLEKWEKDEVALVSIVETHKQIVATCEKSRRQIKALEQKRTDCRSLAGECQDFLDTAAIAAVAQTQQEEELSSLHMEENNETSNHNQIGGMATHLASSECIDNSQEAASHASIIRDENIPVEGNDDDDDERLPLDPTTPTVPV